MFGAIAGDIIGSVHEYTGTKSNDFDLFVDGCRFTDDTILAVAVADCLLNRRDYVDAFHEYFHAYPNKGYGLHFHQWASGRLRQPYQSWGNGSAMRAAVEVALQTPRAPEDYRNILASLGEQCERLTALVNGLLLLARADAALIIGDTALFLDHQSAIFNPAIRNPQSIQKIDLGELWTQSTGLPFVYAVWAGWPDAIGPDEVRVLQRARDLGVAESDQVACAYYPDDSVRQAVAKRYLRDNIQYTLGDEELEGLKTFYRYAAEQGLVPSAGSLRFF